MNQARDGVYVAQCGPYTFESSRMPDNAGYALQVWQIRPGDLPLVVWAMDAYLLEEANAKAERLANQPVPGSLGGLAMSAGTIEVHKLTIREFHALEPFLDPDRHHELLDGQIVVMPIPGNAHSITLNELTAQFVLQRRTGLYVSLGGLRASETTELLPDLSLLEQKPSGPDNPPAGVAKLVVEVAHTTFAYDTGDKLRAYRQAGVPEYWVVDVAGHRLLRYLAPEYYCQIFSGSQTPLSPQAYPDVAIDVGALFS